MRNPTLLRQKKPVPTDLHPTVQALYDDYAKAINEGPLGSWPDLFTDECWYRIVSCENWERGLSSSTQSCEGRDMLEDWVATLRRQRAAAPRVTSVVSSIVICNIDNDAVRTCANWAIRLSMPGGSSQILLEGKYLDTLAQADGRWKFLEKICVFDSDIIPNYIVYPI